jgi:hypothetical protein
VSAVKWYDLRTKQPLPRQDVLVTAISADVPTVFMLYLDAYGRWLWSHDCEPYTGGTITHWMPLPEPAR